MANIMLDTMNSTSTDSAGQRAHLIKIYLKLRKLWALCAHDTNHDFFEDKKTFTDYLNDAQEGGSGPLPPLGFREGDTPDPDAFYSKIGDLGSPSTPIMTRPPPLPPLPPLPHPAQDEIERQREEAQVRARQAEAEEAQARARQAEAEEAEAAEEDELGAQTSIESAALARGHGTR